MRYKSFLQAQDIRQPPVRLFQIVHFFYIRTRHVPTAYTERGACLSSCRGSLGRLSPCLGRVVGCARLLLLLWLRLHCLILWVCCTLEVLLLDCAQLLPLHLLGPLFLHGFLWGWGWQWRWWVCRYLLSPGCLRLVLLTYESYPVDNHLPAPLSVCLCCWFLPFLPLLAPLLHCPPACFRMWGSPRYFPLTQLFP